MAFVFALCMLSSVGGYLWVRESEEEVLDERQEKKDEQTRQQKLLEALGDVKSIEANVVEIVNDQPLNIQEVRIYDRMENNLIKDEMMTGGLDTNSVSYDLGASTEVPGILIVNHNDSGGIVGAKIILKDDTGKVIHESPPIRDVSDAYEYDPNFKSWEKRTFSKVGRNEDGTKIS